ncbi:MAG: transposase [Arenicella sp.]|nr:transposase [Arenicella sp.]
MQPRDRGGSFEPKIIKKRQTRLPMLDSKVIFLYSPSSTTRKIVETLEELLGLWMLENQGAKFWQAPVANVPAESWR